ncbi:MAG: hypothetical protein OQK74_02145 [Gammaproteobacteria bacterium]|jgi:hypothetical protein|nr:hypothetical protein [Gammaproteobacteria bacterium]
MEIALIVILFLVGSVGGAMQALKHVERRRREQLKGESSDESSSGRR